VPIAIGTRHYRFDLKKAIPERSEQQG
jgi:hypothetical protein